MKSLARLPFLALPVFLAPLVASAESGAGLSSWALIPAVADAPGNAGTYWRSDVQILNPSTSQTIVVRMTDLVANEDNTFPYFVDYSIPASAQLVLPNVVRTELDRTGTGALILSTADGSAFVATARTYNTDIVGTYGQTENGQTFVYFEGETALIPGIRNGSGFRSNVGIVSTSSAFAQFVVAAFDSAGYFQGQTSVTLKPWSQTQFSVASFAAAFGTGYLEIANLPGGNQLDWLSYASVVDGSTGDAVFIESRLDAWIALCPTGRRVARDSTPGLPPGSKWDVAIAPARSSAATLSLGAPHGSLPTGAAK